MIQFLKGAIREFKHVVWPTRKETQKFFSLVMAMLVFFGLYLFVASNIFSEIIFGLKGMAQGEVTRSSTSLSQEDIDALFSNEADIEITPQEAIETSTGSVEKSEEELTASGEVTQ